MGNTVFETERLRLTEVTREDAEFIIKLLNQQTFLDNIGDKGIRTLEDAYGHVEELRASYQANGHAMWIAWLKETDEAIGMIGLVKRDELPCPDVGYALLPQFVGKGFASEGAKGSMDYGFAKLGLDKIVGITSETNIGSIRVLENLGLKKDGIVQVKGNDCLLFA